jgi:hypothetical protein
MSKKQNLPEEKKQNQIAIDKESLALAEMGSAAADSSDIIVPRILLMQGTSKWVSSGDAAQGDIIDSVTEEKLGGKGQSFNIIPFYLAKTWEIFDDDSNDWVRSEPWNASNDKLEWQFQEDDSAQGFVSRKRQRQYSFYCFLESDLDTGFPVPKIVTFRSSSGFGEGKKIASHFAMMRGMQQPGYNVTWSLESQPVKDGNKAYQKYVVKKAGNTVESAYSACNQWLKILASNQNIKAHDVEETRETKTAPTETATTQAEASF